MDTVSSLIRQFFLFVKNTAGVLNNPYVTCRKIAKEKEHPLQTAFIFLLILVYFLFASLIRTGIRNPYLLTVKFTSLLTSAAVGLIFPPAIIYLLGKVTGGNGTWKRLFILWSYTLIPTLFWFITTSVLYLVLPPPRTFSVFGKLFSVVFIAFSLSVLLWKTVLYYLTLRFGLRLDLLRIGIISSVMLPLLGVYAVLMYKLGIFRVPFI